MPSWGMPAQARSHPPSGRTFETPRARPDFSQTYYQVMFVDPEGLAIEVYHAHPATEAKA